MSLDKKTVADRYAKALFELVDADNELDQTYQELIALRQVFEDNEDWTPHLREFNCHLMKRNH